jgi:hypothetical protein
MTTGYANGDICAPETDKAFRRPLEETGQNAENGIGKILRINLFLRVRGYREAGKRGRNVDGKHR